MYLKNKIRSVCHGILYFGYLPFLTRGDCVAEHFRCTRFLGLLAMVTDGS